MDFMEEKITNRWRGITPLKDLSVSEEMKKLEEEKIKMEKERRLKSIQRKRKIQKENARMEQHRQKELETLKKIEQDNDRYENERRQKEMDMLRILKEAQDYASKEVEFVDNMHIAECFSIELKTEFMPLATIISKVLILNHR